MGLKSPRFGAPAGAKIHRGEGNAGQMPTLTNTNMRTGIARGMSSEFLDSPQKGNRMADGLTTGSELLRRGKSPTKSVV